MRDIPITYTEYAYVEQVLHPMDRYVDEEHRIILGEIRLTRVRDLEEPLQSKV